VINAIGSSSFECRVIVSGVCGVISVEVWVILIYWVDFGAIMTPQPSVGLKPKILWGNLIKKIQKIF
jgi:hypothetical protein